MISLSKQLNPRSKSVDRREMRGDEPAEDHHQADDASVFMDLAKGRLIEATLALPYDFLIPQTALRGS